MSGQAGRRWRQLAAILLVIFGVPIALVGAFAMLYGLATLRVGLLDVPIDRRTDVGVVFGAAFLVAIGVAHIASAIGLLRRRRWASIVAITISIGAIAISVALIPQAFPLRGMHANPDGPGFINDYESGYLWYVLSAIAYSLIVLSVLISERRDPQFDLRRRSKTTPG